MCLAARGQKKFSSNGFCYVGEKNFRMPSQRAGDAREPPHRRWRQTGWYLPPSSVGVNRRFSEHQRRKPPPHRGQSPLWKNAAAQAMPFTNPWRRILEGVDTMEYIALILIIVLYTIVEIKK